VTVYILAAFDPKRKDVATDSMSRIDVLRTLETAALDASIGRRARLQELPSGQASWISRSA
jgi:hypothetical protein